MHFDDGTNPWLESENTIKVFNFAYLSSSSMKYPVQIAILVTSSLLLVLL